MVQKYEFEEKLKKFMMQEQVQGEHLIFEQSCHSVKDAAFVANADVEDFVKNICLIDTQDNLIVAIVKGENRVSTSRVAKALQIERIRSATPSEILSLTGYPCGGTPSFGYSAKFLLDPKVMEKEFIYTGGGSENSLIKISSLELQRINRGQIIRIRK